MSLRLALTVLSTCGCALGLPQGCDVEKISPGDECKVAWSDLKPIIHPTQNMLGFSWVQYKFDEHMDSQADAQAEFDDKKVPVCKGPGGGFWILDHHHLLAALDRSQWHGVQPTVHLVCDFSDASDLPSFWTMMATHHTAYRYGRPKGSPDALPTEINPLSDIPASFVHNASFTEFVDDPWRSFAGFVRKIESDSMSSSMSRRRRKDKCNNKYCMRGYDKVCDADGRGIPFFEFRWSYFFNSALLNSSMWDTTSHAQVFQQKYAELPLNQLSVDTGPWEDLAKTLFHLCRSPSAHTFRLPASMGATSGPLPKVEDGYGPINEADPTCKLPVCPSA